MSSWSERICWGGFQSVYWHHIISGSFTSSPSMNYAKWPCKEHSNVLSINKYPTDWEFSPDSECSLIALSRLCSDDRPSAVAVENRPGQDSSRAWSWKSRYCGSLALYACQYSLYRNTKWWNPEIRFCGQIRIHRLFSSSTICDWTLIQRRNDQ